MTSNSRRSISRAFVILAALLALTLVAAPTALARIVYTGNYEAGTSGSVSRIDTATNQVVGDPIPTGPSRSSTGALATAPPP